MNSQNLLWLECMYGNICVTGKCHHHSSSHKTHINQMLPQNVHILLDIAPDFVVNWSNRSGLFGGHKSGSSYGWPWSRLLHFWTAASEWCTECQGKHSLRKRSWPAKSIKNDNVISQH